MDHQFDAELRARAVSFALLARLLGPDTTALCDGAHVRALRTALSAAGHDDLAGRLDSVSTLDAADAAMLAGRWVRWFDLGRVPPYEGSNVASTAGGVTPRLADVAGFYRAFHHAVTAERPDHVVAQLEFIALALMAEAEAHEVEDREAVEVVSSAVRGFLRDHLGAWIAIWAARVGGIDELAPWSPVAEVAAAVVANECALRNVIPLHQAPVLPVDAGVADDAHGVLECADPADASMVS